MRRKVGCVFYGRAWVGLQFVGRNDSLLICPFTSSIKGYYWCNSCRNFSVGRKSEWVRTMSSSRISVETNEGRRCQVGASRTVWKLCTLISCRFNKAGAPATCPIMLCTRAHTCVRVLGSRCGGGAGSCQGSWRGRGGAFEGHAHFSSVCGKLVR